MDDFKAYLQSQAADDSESLKRITQRGIGSLDELYAVIRDPEASAEVRKAACNIVRRLASPVKKTSIDRRRALSPLLAALNSPDNDLRIAALWAIGFLQNKRALLPLLKIASDDREPSVRLEAIRALGFLGDTRANPELLKLAENKRAIQMERIFAIIALHDIHVASDTDVLPRLQAIMCDAQDDVEVRGEAAEWLSHMVDNTDMIPSYVQLLQDEAVSLRFWAAFGLVTMSWLDISEALPIIDHAVAYDTAVLPGWWSVSREAVPALEHTWYQRLSGCTGEACCCGERTYLISSLWEYWDYRQKSYVSGGGDTHWVPHEQQTSINIDPEWLSGELSRRWRTVRVNVRQPRPEAALLDWQIDMENGMLLGGLHRDGQCLFLTGDKRDVAAFAVWYRMIIPQQHTLRLYDWADPGQEIHASMTPEHLLAALNPEN